jgi:hypothetical protein
MLPVLRTSLASASGPARTCCGPGPYRQPQPGMDILGMGGLSSIMVCRGGCTMGNSSGSYSCLKWVCWLISYIIHTDLLISSLVLKNIYEWIFIDKLH